MRIFISDTNIFIFVAKRDAEGVVPYKEKVNFMGLGKLYQTDKLYFFSKKGKEAVCFFAFYYAPYFGSFISLPNAK